MRVSRQYLLPILLCLVFVAPCKAFSILAHEAVIDASWNSQLKPALLKKYPDATPDDLKQAQAYAYGGSLVADMGYMPMGSPYFTNLLHYVRSGDMIMTLISEAHDLNEYAFALGALSHYITDKYGHALATNPSVALFYPHLQRKFGNVVTYDDDHTSHSSMEFAFDVIQTVKGNYASNAYHNFIGFNIALPVLRRAFLKTYGQNLDDVFPHIDRAINTFRWGVRNLFPQLARVAWRSDQEGIRQSREGITRQSFCYRMPQQAFDKEYGKQYRQSGLTARSLALLIEAMPKVGPLKKLEFRYPGIACEELYLRSMDTILINYGKTLQQASAASIQLANIDFDTGNATTMHEYALADKAYKEWLQKLEHDKPAQLSPAIQKDILTFYKRQADQKSNEELALLASVIQ